MTLATFTKPPLPLADQLKLLTDRGLRVTDTAQALHYLKHIGYYRLGGYAHFFQNVKNGVTDDTRHHFLAGTTFDDILDCYIFDRKLRLLAMDAIERIENSFRSALSNFPSINNGAHWYTNPALFRQIYDGGRFIHANLISELKEQIGHDSNNGRKRDTYIKHYYNTYSSPDMPPCWAVLQSVSFGTISRMFRYLIDSESKPIAKCYGLNHAVISSWLHSLSYVRNVCAHHSLLWNRKCRIKPMAAKAYASEFKSNEYVYAQFVVMQVLLHTIAPENHWALRLRSLLGEHPNISLISMGFPTDWQSRSIWKLPVPLTP